MSVSPIQVDQSGNSYVDISNLRLTFVQAARRQKKKRWTNQDVIRVQAYKGKPANSKALHLGAEFPLKGDAKALADLISGICQLYSATH